MATDSSSSLELKTLKVTKLSSFFISSKKNLQHRSFTFKTFLHFKQVYLVCVTEGSPKRTKANDKHYLKCSKNA